MKTLRHPQRVIPAGLFMLGAWLLAIAFLTPDSWASEPSFREIKVKRGNLTSKLLTTGRIQPENRVDIKASIAGRVEQVLVNEGDRVKKGQVLLLISSSQRASILDAARFVSQKELKHWEKANPATQLIAPVDGTIIQRVLEPGQTFGDTTAILVLADRFIIEAPVDETDVSRIRVGQAANTVLDAYPDEKILSHVLQVSHEAKTIENVTSYMMKVTMDQVPDHARVGMTANVTFDMDAKKDVFLIPSEALKADDKNMYVFVGPGGGEEPEKRIVRTGLTDGTMTEITTGVSEGDIVYIPLQTQTKAPAEEPKKNILSL